MAGQKTWPPQGREICTGISIWTDDTCASWVWILRNFLRTHCVDITVGVGCWLWIQPTLASRWTWLWTSFKLYSLFHHHHFLYPWNIPPTEVKLVMEMVSLGLHYQELILFHQPFLHNYISRITSHPSIINIIHQHFIILEDHTLSVHSWAMFEVFIMTSSLFTLLYVC